MGLKLRMGCTPSEYLKGWLVKRWVQTGMMRPRSDDWELKKALGRQNLV